MGCGGSINTHQPEVKNFVSILSFLGRKHVGSFFVNEVLKRAAGLDIPTGLTDHKNLV